MSFMKSVFSGKKTRGTDSGGRSPGMNGSPGGVRKSPASGGAVAASRSRESASPKHNPKKYSSPQSNGRGDTYDPTEEEIEAMNLPFKEKLSNKRDKNLSISRSGRHKYKTKQRMSVLTQDIYSDIPADKNQDSSSTGGASSGSKSGYRGVEAHSRQFQSHQRPALSISGASTAV